MPVDKCSKPRKDRKRSPSPECRKRSLSPECRKRSLSPECRSFAELYEYYKYQLLTDDRLMVAGSNAYANATNVQSDKIPKEFPIDLKNNVNLVHVDHFNDGAPFHVRKAGIYALFFVISTDNAAQVAVYVNGVAMPLSRVGNNSGSGQLRIQTLLDLKKNDGIVIRNSDSSSAAIQSDIGDGGLENGNPSTILIMRIGVSPADLLTDRCEPEFTRCQLKLYKKLKNKMLTDHALMLKGSNAYGSFFTYLEQTIPVNADIQWDNMTQVTGLTWDPLLPERATVTVDGVYKVLFVLNTDRAAQLTICVNGIPQLSTTQGVNKGASQISSRTLLELKAGDYITVRNYTSSIGQVKLIENSGGLLPAIAAVLVLYKIAPPLVLAVLPPKPAFCLSDDDYTAFLSYLHARDELTIQGTTRYLNLTSDTNLKIPVDAAIDFNIMGVTHGFSYLPGTPSITIEQSGVYLILFDILTAQPSQVTMFVNNVPDLLTTSGRDSGGSRLNLTQLVSLKQGDVIDFRNYISSSELEISLNAGGNLVGNARKVGILLIAPADEEVKHKHMYCKPVPREEPKKVDKEYVFY